MCNIKNIKKPVKCSIINCKNTSLNSEITFHLLPNNNVPLKQAWIETCRLSICNIKKKTYVCSSHFKPEDYLRSGKYYNMIFFIASMKCKKTE